MFNEYPGFPSSGFYDVIEEAVEPTGFGAVDQDLLQFLLGDGQ